MRQIVTQERWSAAARAVLASLVIALAGVGCAEGPDASADEVSDATKFDPGPSTVPGASRAIPTAGTLGVEFGTEGPEGTIPSAITVDFDHRIVDRPTNALDDDTEVRIEPHVDGRWRFAAPDRLQFTPSTPFEPDTEYTVILSSVGLERGDGDGEDGGASARLEPRTPWKHSYRMPEFELLEMTTPVVDSDEGNAWVDLIFSAGVTTEQLNQKARWTIDGMPVGFVSYETDSSGRIVRVELIHSSLRRGDGYVDVGLELDAGVEMAALPDQTAPATTREATGEYGARVSIKRILVEEGVDGHYFYVICDDAAVDGDDVYFRNLHGYHDYRVSRRCTPDVASAREHIQITPKTDFEIAPASGGFQIRGDFQREGYTLRISSGLRTVDGGLFHQTRQLFRRIGPRSSVAEIVGEGRYIPPEAWDNLAIRHRNVDELEVEIRHVPRENLVFWMTGRRENAGERTSNLVGKTTVGLHGKPDQVGSRFLDIGSIVGERKPGLYQVKISSEHGASDTARLLLTDINLLAKRSAAAPGETWSDEVFVWALDMHTGKPRRDVRIKLVRPSGYAMARCRTDRFGACRLRVPSKDVDPTAPVALVASDRDDLTFLKYDEVRTRVTGADVSGEPYLSKRSYRAAVYGDRDLYRPAETIHMVGVIRKDGQRTVGSGLPVEYELHDARGRLADSGVLDTNENGMVGIDHDLGDLSPTGRWRLRLLVGKKEVAKHDFFVEEFVPERMEVTVESESEGFYPEEQPIFGVHARYLFGASAEGSKVELRCRLEPQTYRPAGHTDYKFGPAPFESADQNAIDLGKATGTVGEDDVAAVGCPEKNLTGAVGGKIVGSVSVMEAGSGRTTDEQASAWLHPEHFYIGLKSGTEKVSKNETVEITGVVVDPAGEVYRDVDAVELDFIQLQRNRSWYYDRARHRHRRKSNWQPIIESTKTVKVRDGTFSVEVTPSTLRDGYAVRARAEDAVSTLQLDTDRQHYRSWWWSRRNNRTPRPEDPTQIQIEGPDEVEVGERETIRFNAPFPGRALITLETHRVVDYAWKEVRAGQNSWSFELTDRVPNVYATVFLMKDPHEGKKGAFMPERAFGVQSLRVDRSPFEQSLEVEVPDEVRPSSRLEVVVDAGRQTEPTYVTVAAVDEGVLQLTDYETPNPLDSLIGRRALGVDTFDTVGWNVHMPTGGQNGDPGGGGGGGNRENTSGRIMPIEPVALWSGIVKLPESGRKTIAFDVPEYRGELRVMAVGVGSQKVGVADTSVKVRDPLALQATTPRFLTHNDQVEIPVFVTNTTGQEQSVEVSIGAEPIELPGSTALSSLIDPVSFPTAKKTGTIADGESRTFVFKAEAVAQSGGARFHIKATGEGYTSTSTKKLPIHPAQPRQRLVSTVKVRDGKTKMDKHLRGWVEHSERSTFWVSDVPYADSFDHLKPLIRYPHGCVEQTSSATRPMVFLSELMQTVDPESAYSSNEIERRVRAGLDRILSMQTSQGGFAYWPGGSRPSIWGTTTATHLLIDAKKAGYKVPQARLDDALDWLADSVRGNRYRWANGYTAYVLAQTGRANRGQILRQIGRYEEDPSGWKAEQLYLLKAALYMAGDRRYEDELRNPDLTADTGELFAWRSFYSDFRRKAFVLNVYVDVFGHGEEGAALSQSVARVLAGKGPGTLNTQEMTWGITGLGKWIKQSGNSIERAELTAGGKTVPVAADNSYGVSWSLARAADYDDIELDLKTAESKPTYLVLSSYGVRKEPTVEYGGEGLTVDREYIDAKGQPLEDGELGLGDMAFVRLTLSNQTNSDVQNVALVDRIPAGWEIENPRHSDKQAMSDLYNRERWQQDYLEVRDDRMKVFGTVPGGHTVQVVYAARATLAGEFTAPSVHAESMYNAEIWARKRATTVRVESAWGELVD